jgi:hypothetical protein
MAEVAQLLISDIDILDVELREVKKSSHGVRSGPWLEESESLGVELCKFFRGDIQACFVAPLLVMTM